MGVESNVCEISGHAILDSSPSYCLTAPTFTANVGLNIENESTDVTSFVNLFFSKEF
jgi:hypothetical protein